jgi:hypothetical protein
MPGKPSVNLRGLKPEKELNKMPEEEKENWEASVLARVIIEILGAPKDYIENTLKVIAEDIAKNPLLRVEKKEFFDAKEQDKLFSAFMELEIRFRGIAGLFGFCIDYLPSSIDIIEPEQINYDSKDITDNVNDLMAKLHMIDSAMKNIKAENEILQHNAMLLLRNNVIQPRAEQDERRKPFKKNRGSCRAAEKLS